MKASDGSNIHPLGSLTLSLSLYIYIYIYIHILYTYLLYAISDAIHFSTFDSGLSNPPAAPISQPQRVCPILCCHCSDCSDSSYCSCQGYQDFSSNQRSHKFQAARWVQGGQNKGSSAHVIVLFSSDSWTPVLKELLVAWQVNLRPNLLLDLRSLQRHRVLPLIH